ncbi:MAG TPA: alpha/beta fold hydrolase [Acidimicrobiia bacterium]|nr:alpha/beta fold hydrolase [Acidimicrobiia bacterium]
MDSTIRTADGCELASYFTRPPGTTAVPGLVLCHGFPSGPRGSAASGLTYPELADRLARDAGWAVLTFNFRGTGASAGDFSIGGWLADQRAAVNQLAAREDVSGVWLVGSSLGGALGVQTAADDQRVRGLATLAAPAVLRRWAREPARFLEHARSLGVFRTPGFPPTPAAWAREIAEVDTVGAARAIPPRPLLVLHGSEDGQVPVEEAREIAEAADGSAELRIVYAAGHGLRHDPRAIAALLGWLDRQYH